MQPLRFNAPHTLTQTWLRDADAGRGIARGPHHKRKLLELCARIGYTPPHG